MLQVVRHADSEDDSTTTVDLHAPLTALSCQPRHTLASSTSSSSSTASILHVVPIPSPSPPIPSLQSGGSVAHLVLIQRSSTGHHYLFNYGTAPMRHNSRRIQQQRLPISAHISRCVQWQTEQQLDQPHIERSEVPGTGGKPLEDGDQVEVGGRLYVYWSHSHSQPSNGGGSAINSGLLHTAAGGADLTRTRKSGRRAVRPDSQMAVTEEEVKDQGSERTMRGRPRVKHRENGASQSDESVLANESSGRRRARKQRMNGSSSPLLHQPAVAAHSSGTRHVAAIKPRMPRKKRTRQGKLSESAIARIAAFARQRQRGANGAFLKVRRHTGEDDGDEELEGDGDDEEQHTEQMEGEAEEGEEGVQVERRSSAVGRARRRHALSNGAVSAASRRKRRRDGSDGSGCAQLDDNEGEEEQSSSDAVEGGASTRPVAARLNGTAARQRRQQQSNTTTFDSPAEDERVREGRGREMNNPAVTDRHRRSQTTQKRQRRQEGKEQNKHVGADTAAPGEREERPEEEEQAEAAVAEQDREMQDDSLDSSGPSQGGHSARKRVVRARRSARGKMRQTRSSGPVAVSDSRQWPEPDERKQSRRRHRNSQPKKASELRRMRRTPLSLLPNLPPTLAPLLPLLTCTVCNQLFVQPVSLPCMHSFCDYCLYARLQLKQSACPQCDKPVDDEQRKRGTYAMRSGALDSIADAVAMLTLDVKGKRARARRQRVDTADMKHVRAAWKRRQGAERGRERRQRERERVEDELSALLGRRRYRTSSSRRVQVVDDEDGTRSVLRDSHVSDSDEDDDDYEPASDIESDDSAALKHSDSGESGTADHSDASSTGQQRSHDDSGSSSTSDSAAVGSSDDIQSSEEDSVEMDHSVILPQPVSAARRLRPQRTRYELMSVPKRSRPPCRGCSLPLNQSELAIRVIHGTDVRWSHITCLRFSTAGRTIPLQRIDGMEQLTAAEQQAVRDAWSREADDGQDSADGGLNGEDEQHKGEDTTTDEEEQHRAVKVAS